jgi:NAD(P)-dependent dehydrogenase (short-subunit alcohol dehydrogenase family)
MATRRHDTDTSTVRFQMPSWMVSSTPSRAGSLLSTGAPSPPRKISSIRSRCSADRLLDAISSFETALTWPETLHRIQTLLERGLQRDVDFEKRWPDEVAIKRLAQHVPQAKVEGAAADLAAAAGVAAFVRRVGETDILVNNLGIFEPKPFGEITEKDWQRLFETNVMSGVRLSRHYLPSMVSRGWGRIVFISSESALNIPVEMIHYGMTKTAQLAISRGLAQSVAGTGVTVNAVLPGPTRSEGVLDFFAKLAREHGVSQPDVEKQFISEHRPTSLIRRLATVEEVANLVVFVCSLQASATTGAALRVDGGVVQSIA